MSLFGRITSLGDVLSRIPQLASQVVKLEKEEPFARGEKSLRGSFVKRCHELQKQVEDQKKKVEALMAREGSNDQKEDALEKLNDFQSRVSVLAPERERSSADRTSSVAAETNSEAKQSDDGSPDEDPGPRRAPGYRRPSMYDNIDEDDSSDGEEKPAQPKPKTVPTVARAVEPTPPAPKVEEVPRTDRSKQRVNVLASSDPPPSQPSRSRIVSVRTKGDEEPKRAAEPTQSVPVAPSPPPPRVLVDGATFAVLADLSAAEATDLSVKKGEILTILQTRADGWWTARNSQGAQGLVPKTFLRHVPLEELRNMEERQDEEEDESRPIGRDRSESPPAPLPVIGRGATRTAAVVESPPQSPQQDTLPPIRYTGPRRPMSPRQEESREPVGQIQIPVVPVVVRCLGDALRSDIHLSAACHLTPRLSHSNLAFHDLYWNYEDDKIRKRRIRVSRMFRLVRLEGMPREPAHCILVRVALYDNSRKTGRQLVSNVHTIRAQSKNGTWSFINRADTTNSGVELCDFVVRSNYRLSNVVLLMEASMVQATHGSFEEVSLGIVTLPIVSEKTGECCLLNKTYTDQFVTDNIFEGSNGLKTACRLVMKVLAIPDDILHYVDSMPDVLIFNPMFVRLYYFYRRRAGTVLIRDKSNPLSAEMVSDPMLAVFPFIADQPDMMDLLRSLWNTRLKTVKNKSDKEQAQSFFQIFMNTAYCIHRTAIIPDYCIWDQKVLRARQELFNKCVDMYREYKSAARFLLTTPSRPINIFDYSLDLLGPHALD